MFYLEFFLYHWHLKWSILFEKGAVGTKTKITRERKWTVPLPHPFRCCCVPHIYDYIWALSGAHTEEMSISHRQELSYLCIYLYIATRGRVIRGCVFFFSPYGLSDKASACTISMWFILQRFQKPPILHSYRESESRIFYQWLGFEIEIHLLLKKSALIEFVLKYYCQKLGFFICWVNPPPPPFAVHLHEIFDSCIENESMFNISKKKCTTLFNFLL